MAFYFYREKVALHELTHRWRHGIIGGAAASVLLLGNILAQPASARPEGVELAAALVWVGVIYAHVVLHIAAVLRGMDTMLQLPPHYPG